jgi:hypothetical protein
MQTFSHNDSVLRYEQKQAKCYEIPRYAVFTLN